MLDFKYDKKTIEKKRKEISKELINRSNTINSYVIKEISNEDIKILFKLYDSIFLHSWFANNFQGNFKFSISKRMTKSAGYTLCPKNISKLNPKDIVIEIRIGINFFLQYDILNETKVVGGIETKSSLEALQLVLEHEICHALEFINFYKSSCRGDRFKAIANNLFGHTSSYHQLPTSKKLAKEMFNLNIGDKVFFTYKSNRLNGFIYRINKRATVMVEDKVGQYVDSRGNRYSKYYIPLDRLETL